MQILCHKKDEQIQLLIILPPTKACIFCRINIAIMQSLQGFKSAS
jgi:hypothetical protein